MGQGEFQGVEDLVDQGDGLAAPAVGAEGAPAYAGLLQKNGTTGLKPGGTLIIYLKNRLSYLGKFSPGT